MHRTLIIAILLFSLAISVQAQDGGSLPFGQTIRGELSPGTPEQSWTFVAPPGALISLDLNRVGGTAPLILQLTDATNATVVRLNTDYVGQIDLPKLYLDGGPYTLAVIGDFSDTITTATFDLLATVILPDVTPTAPAATPTVEVSGPEVTRLNTGDSVDSAISQPGEVDRFSFLGYAGDEITFGMSRQADDTLDPYLELQAPSGEIIVSADDHEDSLDALVLQYELPATGVYTLFASSADGQGTGRYLIALNTGFILRDMERGIAAHNEPLIEELDGYGVREVWLAEIETGDRVSVSVEVWGDEPTTFDPMVELVSPSGESLGFDNDSGAGNNAILSGIYAPETGTYRIHIAAQGHRTVGTYRLWWQRDNLFPTPTPPPPTATLPVTPTIPPPTGTPTPIPVLDAQGSRLFTIESDQVVIQHIDVEPGQSILLFVEGHWGFDAVLEVYGPDGTLVEQVDDLGNASNYDINPRLNLVFEQGGRYTIQVYGYESSAGSFTLHWHLR